MKKIVTISIIMLLFVTANATVLFYDDFNRPDSSVVGNGWTDDGVPSLLDNGIVNGTMKVGSHNEMGIYRTFDNINSGVYYIQYDWKVTSNDWLAYNFPGENAVFIYHTSTGTLEYDLNSNHTSAVQFGTLPIDEWKTVKLKVDIDNDTFSIWLDDVLCVNNLNSNSVVLFSSYYFRAYSASTIEQYIDDFIVYDDTPPDTPQNLTATENIDNITLNWDSVPDSLFVTYRIYRDETPTASTIIDSVESPITTYIDNVVTPIKHIESLTSYESTDCKKRFVTINNFPNSSDFLSRPV